MCTRPLKGFLNGLTENGKKNLIVTSYDVDHIEFLNNHRYFVKDCHILNKRGALTDWIELPCGQCIECRLQRSRQWANRCMLELQYHTSSYFLTLTYDNEHLPTSEVINDDTGEINYNATLVKKHFQDFMKRLRRAYEYAGFDNKLRFFGCGEYGSESMRPHFHIIVFGLQLPLGDLHFYKKNIQGDILYNSDLVSKCWKYGFSVVGEVTWQSCAYVARYIMKKHLGKDSDFYDIYGIEPEFVLMSRRPGIAREYYDDNKEQLFSDDFVTVPTNQGSLRVYPPAYFEKLFELDFPEQDVCERKEKRKQSKIVSTDLELERTDLNYLDYLAVKEYNLDKKIKTLVRGDC